MQLQPWTFDGHDIQDNNFESLFPEASIFIQAEGSPGLVPRIHRSPSYTYKGRNAKTLPVHIKMLGTIHEQKSDLDSWFNTFNEDLQTLVARDIANSNELWQVEATTINTPAMRGQEAIYNLLVPDPIWQTVRSRTATWSVTANSATASFAVGGNQPTNPTISLQPTAANSGGNAYRVYATVRNQHTASVTAYPVDIVNNGWNTSAIITDTSINCLINATAGITASATTIPYDTVTGTFPTGGLVMIETEQVSFTGRTGTTSGNLTGCTRGANGTTKTTHANNTQINLSHMAANGSDISVTIDGAQSNWWVQDPNTTTTQLWANLTLAPGQSLTLGVAITASATPTAITFENSTANTTALEALPQRGYLLIGTEQFYYTAKNVTGLKVSGVKRSVRNTSAGAHSVSDTIYWIQHDIQILYGNHDMASFTVDNDYQPMFNLTSTNTSWDYDNFAITNTAGTEITTRPGRWRHGSFATPLVLTDTPYNSGVQGVYYNTMTATAPATQTDFVSKTFAVAGSYSDYSLSVTHNWYAYSPLGFTNIVADGKKWREGANWWSTAKLRKSNTQASGYSDIASIATPTAAGSTQAWTASASLAGTYKWILFTVTDTNSAASNEMRLEMNNFTGTLDSTKTPVVPSVGTEQQVYHLLPRITNNGTNEYISIDYVIPLSDHLVVNTENKTVTHTEDGVSRRGALSTDVIRFEWLPLASGTRTLKYTETGVKGVTILVTWNDRHT